MAPALELQEIDPRIRWAVNGEDPPVRAYSRNERLASRLIRCPQRNDIVAAIDAGTGSCVLRRARRIALGSAETRAPAVARDVANGDFAAASETRPRPRGSGGSPRHSGPRGERRCVVCDPALGPSKGPMRARPLCSSCSWQRTRPRLLPGRAETQA